MKDKLMRLPKDREIVMVRVGRKRTPQIAMRLGNKGYMINAEIEKITRKIITIRGDLISASDCEQVDGPIRVT